MDDRAAARAQVVGPPQGVVTERAAHLALVPTRQLHARTVAAEALSTPTEYPALMPTLRRLLPLLVFFAPTALAQQPPALADHERVRADLAAIVSRIELERGASVAYTGSLTAVNIIRGRALICTVACEELPSYQGLFFTWSEVDGRAVGELMTGAGVEGVRVLKGAALEEYLERIRLDPSPLRAAFQRFYPPPAPGGG